MRVHPFVIPFVIVIALLGTVLTAQAAGLWSTSGRDSVDVADMTAADLKGWMTLQQVMDGLHLSREQLYAAARIPADVPAETALKDVEGIVDGFSIATLRTALAAQPEAPASVATQATPATVLIPVTPIPAPTIVHTGDGTGTGPTPLPPGQVLPADQIKGKMTLREVSQQCAVPLEKLLTALKLPAGTNPDTALKDLIAGGQLSAVTDVQAAVVMLQVK